MFFLWPGQTFMGKTVCEGVVTGQQLRTLRYLATEIHHTDFSYHCKDFKGKEWHVFKFYAGVSSSKAIVASMGTGTCPCLVRTKIVFYIPISRDQNNTVLRVITINSFQFINQFQRLSNSLDWYIFQSGVLFFLPTKKWGKNRNSLEKRGITKECKGEICIKQKQLNPTACLHYMVGL